MFELFKYTKTQIICYFGDVTTRLQLCISTQKNILYKRVQTHVNNDITPHVDSLDKFVYRHQVFGPAIDLVPRQLHLSGHIEQLLVTRVHTVGEGHRSACLQSCWSRE